MNRVNRDIVWRLLTTLIVDILNPTLLISLALFVSVGYILTLLMPVTIEIWLAVFWLTLLLPLAGLVALAGHKWKQGEFSAKPFYWRALLPLVPLLITAPSFYVEFTSPPFQLMSSASASKRAFSTKAWPSTIFSAFSQDGKRIAGSNAICCS